MSVSCTMSREVAEVCPLMTTQSENFPSEESDMGFLLCQHWVVSLCFVWTLTIFLVVSFISYIHGSGILSMAKLYIEGLISADPWANFWPTSAIDWYVMAKFVIQHCTESSLFISSLSIHFSGPWHSLIRIAFPKPSWSSVWFLFHQIIQMNVMLGPGDHLSGTLQLGVVQFNNRNTNIVWSWCSSPFNWMCVHMKVSMKCSTWLFVCGW